MRRLELKRLSFEKQMTVLLPLVMSFSLLCGILIVSRLRETETVNGGEGQPMVEDLSLSITAPIEVLFILHEQEEIFFTVLHIDPAGQVTVAPVIDDKSVVLYQKEGAAVLRDACAATYYADITFDNMREILQYYGEGAAVTLSEPLQYTDDTGLSVSFPAGKLHLSANQFIDMLHALQGEAQATTVVTAMQADMFNRYINEKRDLADLYTTFAAYANTDIRIYDFEKYLPLIQTIAARTPLAQAKI